MKNNLLYIALATLILTSCQSNKEENTSSAQDPNKFCLNEQLKKSTIIDTVSEDAIHEQLTLSGKVEYNENDLVAVKSLLQGIVESVRFELGDYVNQGQVLAVVKSTEIQGLAQEKKYHQNQVDLLRKQIQIKKELVNDGLASQPELTELEHQLQASLIEVQKVSGTLSMYRSVGNGQFQIIAPKNGYVVRKNISVGQSLVADNEDALFAISNLKQVWVMVNIYANNLQSVKVGDLVKVKTVAYPDRLYAGKIDKIYNVFDDDEHVIKARVVLENQNLNLMPGLSADIIIDKQNVLGTAFAIPNKAVVFDNNNNYIVVYTNDCEMQVRKITPIGNNANHTYIEEKLKKGERVLSSNALLVYAELNK